MKFLRSRDQLFKSKDQINKPIVIRKLHAHSFNVVEKASPETSVPARGTKDASCIDDTKDRSKAISDISSVLRNFSMIPRSG